MSKTNELQIPICTGCNHTIPPNSEAVKFKCPQCGDIVIWRCEKCRRFGHQYRCPKCGFQGP